MIVFSDDIPKNLIPNNTDKTTEQLTYTHMMLFNTISMQK